MEATVRYLRLHTAEVLAAVARGERVLVTQRGRPRAMLVRYDASESVQNLKRNPAFGLWTDQDEDCMPYVERMLGERRQAWMGCAPKQ